MEIEARKGQAKAADFLGQCSQAKIISSLARPARRSNAPGIQDRIAYPARCEVPARQHGMPGFGHPQGWAHSSTVARAQQYFLPNPPPKIQPLTFFRPAAAQLRLVARIVRLAAAACGCGSAERVRAVAVAMGVAQLAAAAAANSRRRGSGRRTARRVAPRATGNVGSHDRRESERRGRAESASEPEEARERKTVG